MDHSDPRCHSPLLVHHPRFAADDLRGLRGAVGAWFDDHDWPVVARLNLVRAVSEISTRILGCAYLPQGRGPISVQAEIWSNTVLRYAVIEIRDAGLLRTPPTPDKEMRVARDCVDDVAIWSHPSGTTTTLTSRPVPLTGTFDGVQG